MTSDLAKSQLTTILSALDDQPRNPNTKAAALKAIAKSAAKLTLTVDDVLAAAPGLLDGRLSPVEFRHVLYDVVDNGVTAIEPDTGATTTATAGGVGQSSEV